MSAAAAASSATAGKENKKPQRAFKKGIDGEEARRKREEVRAPAPCSVLASQRTSSDILVPVRCAGRMRKLECFGSNGSLRTRSGVHRNSQEQA
jgi:hypothetical protein